MSELTVPQRDDRVALRLPLAVAGVIGAATLYTTISRLIEVASGHDVPVEVPLGGQPVDLPLGPGGAMVQGTVDSAVVTVAEPSGLTLAALWVQPLWTGACALAGLALAVIFIMRVARGDVFSSNSSRLALYGASVVTAAWLGSSALNAVAANGARTAISEGTFSDATLYISLEPLLAVLLIGTLGVALQIGERLQRETEGLV